MGNTQNLYQVPNNTIPLIKSLSNIHSPDEYLNIYFEHLQTQFHIQEIVFWIYEERNNILIEKKATSKFSYLNQTLTDNHNNNLWNTFINNQTNPIHSNSDLFSTPEIKKHITANPHLHFIPYYQGKTPLGLFLINFANIQASQISNHIQAIQSQLKITAPLFQTIILKHLINSYATKLRLFNTASKKLTASLDSTEIYHTLQKAASKFMPNTTTIIVSSYDQTNQMIHPVYIHQDGKELDISQFEPKPLAPHGKGYQSQVIRTKQTLIVNNFQQDISEKTKNYQIIGSIEEKNFSQSSIYAPMLAKGEIIGVLNLQSYQNYYYNQDHAELFAALSNAAATAIKNATLFEALKQTNLELNNAYDETLLGWSKAVELKDKNIEYHNMKVSELSRVLAIKMGLSEDKAAQIYRGALLHDIGKIAIPDSILQKPGKLTPEEWVIMRQHPLHAYKMLSEIDHFKPIIAIPLFHHEKWDGTGYPYGLSGENIPLSARIFAVIDVFDGLNSDRPYRKAMPSDEIIQYIKKQSNHHFDPKVVTAFLSLINHS